MSLKTFWVSRTSLNRPSSQVKGGSVFWAEGRRVARCQALRHALAWQTPTWSQQWQSPNPENPSFLCWNPNEDLKCSAGRRHGGCGYTLPLLALPVIVSLSPYWPSLAGDERDMTAWWAFVHRPHACPALREARFHSLPQTTGMTSSGRRRDKTNRSCLLRHKRQRQNSPFSLICLMAASNMK